MGNSKGTRRANGEGSVFKTTNNGYEGWLAVITGTDEDGKPYRISGWSRASEADAIRRRHKNLMKALAKDKHAAVTRGPMFLDYYQEWLNRPPKRAPNSLRAIETSFKWVTPYFEERRVNSITQDDLEQWLWTDLEEDGCGNSARVNAYINLKAYLNYCVKKNAMQFNPLAAIREDSVRKPAAVNADDQRFIGKRTNIVKYMLDEMAGDPDHPNREHLPLMVFLALGLRRGELLGLSWSQVSNLGRKGCSVTIDRQLYKTDGAYFIAPWTKGKKARHIPAPSIWQEVLKEQKAKNLNALAKDDISKDLVFLDAQGNFLKYDTYYAIWRKCLTDYINKHKADQALTKGDYFRPHFMRKISISLAHRIGIPVTTIMEIAGHSSEEVNAIYRLLSKEEKTEAVESLGNALKVVRKSDTAGRS